MGQGAGQFHRVMDDPQIHRALSSLWDPAADAGGGGSSYRVVRGFILKTDSRHLSRGKLYFFETYFISSEGLTWTLKLLVCVWKFPWA